MVLGLGFRVQGLGFRVFFATRLADPPLECRVQGSGFRVQGSGFRV